MQVLQENADIQGQSMKSTLLQRKPLVVMQNNSSPAASEEKMAPLQSVMEPVSAEAPTDKEAEEAITREMLISAINDTRALKSEMRKDRLAAQADHQALETEFDASSTQAAKATAFREQFSDEVKDIKRRVENIKMGPAIAAYEASTKAAEQPPKTPPKGPHVARTGPKSTKKRAVKSFKAHANEKAAAKLQKCRSTNSSSEFSGVNAAMVAGAFAMVAMGMYLSMMMK